LKWYDGGGENGITSKRIFEVEVFSPLKILTSLYLKRLLAFLSPPLFSSLFFFAPSLEDLGVLMIFEEKIASSKTSFQMASIYWWWTRIFRNGVMHTNMAKQ
jgi:hypothetical protein